MKKVQAVGVKALIGGALLAAAIFVLLIPSPAMAGGTGPCQTGQIEKSISAGGSAWVKNLSDQTCTFYLASYEINNDGGSWPYISSQTLHQFSSITLGPGEAGNLSTGVPSCEYQLDLVNIYPISPPTYSSGNFLGVKYGGPSNHYCNQESPPPSPPPTTPPPTTPPPPTVDIKANSSDGPITIQAGTAANLTWTSTNATACTVNPGGFTGTQNSAGQTTGNLNGSQTYTITCTGAGGSIQDSVIVNVTQACVAPTVTTTAASNVTQTSATLNASVNANGSNTSVFFEYGTSQSLGTTTNTQSIGNGTSPIQVSAPIANLQPNTTYYYRVVATNGCGSGNQIGAIVSFTTTGSQSCIAPLVTTASATNVTQTSATLNGTVVNNGNLITSAFFEYGTTQNLGSTGLIFTVPANTTRQITNDIQNLQPNTTYYFRLVAQNPCGGANIPGTIFSFTTGTGSTVGPTVDIKANGQDGTVTVQNNTSAFISWTSTNANSCVVSPTGWTGAPNGGQNSQNITGSITFTVTCTGTNNQTATDSVTVVPTGGSGTTPTVTLVANPTSITQGQSSTLSWTSANATTCYASGGPWSGNKTIGSGFEVVTPPFTSTYTITCTGTNGQTASASATVFVNPTSGTGSTSITKLVRNVTLNQIGFLQSVEAQGLDTLEFEIRVQNTDSVARTITVQDILPAELFYISGSTTVDGVTTQDGITTGGLNLGLMNPGQLRIVHFRAMVFFGTSERTVTNQATANGSGFANAYANVVIRNRGGQGQVLGAADIVTGADDALPIAAAIGFVLAVIFHWFARKRGWYAAGARRIEESKRAIEDVIDDLAARAQKSYATSRPDRFVL